MKFRHPNCHHTYPKPDGLRYSLAFNHNSYSYPTTLLVLRGLAVPTRIEVCARGTRKAKGATRSSAAGVDPFVRFVARYCTSRYYS